jgi:hypothetical protein
MRDPNKVNDLNLTGILSVEFKINSEEEEEMYALEIELMEWEER